MENAEFELFLGALRQGDEAAASKLLQDYGPEISRLIRARLARAGLRRITDPSDVCQSVLFNFLQHAAEGQVAPLTPAELSRLLRTMAVNKLTDLVRHEQAERRDCRRVIGGSQGRDETGRAADVGSTPSQQAERADLLDRFPKALSAWARRVHEWRALAWTWEEIARELGAEEPAVRIRFARETQRVARQLGLNESR
jgi:DNA-directed RNA polymerase specialized sigma24 family protein